MIPADRQRAGPRRGPVPENTPPGPQKPPTSAGGVTCDVWHSREGWKPGGTVAGISYNGMPISEAEAMTRFIIPSGVKNEGHLGTLLRAVVFSAERHRNQRRKGVDGSPYINHPLEVAEMLANVAGVQDLNVLIAAVLHDTIEDTKTTSRELEEAFGSQVRLLVEEVTDDKSLPKPERKRLQIEHAPLLSPSAKLIKLADKVSNVRDIADRPPADWTVERRREYLDWATRVVAGCRGVSETLEREFDNAMRRARQLIPSAD